MTAEIRSTQAAQLLALLREAGDEGVHTATIHRNFIVNASQRRQDLVDAGYNIEVSERRERSPYGPSMGVRYWLRSGKVPIGIEPSGQSFLIAERAA